MQYLLLIFLGFTSPFLIAQNCNLDSLKLELTHQEDPESEMSLLYKIAICYDFGSIDSSLHYCQLSEKLSESYGNRKWTCRSNSKLMILYARTGQYEAAEAAAKKCHAHCQTDDEFSKVWNNQAIYYGISNQPYKAIEVLTKSKEINEKSGNADGVAKSLMNMAANYGTLSEHEKALELLSHALHINDSLGTGINLAINYNMLAHVYEEIDNNEQALSAIDKAIEYIEALGMQQRLAFSYYNKGTVLKKLGRRIEAVELHEQAKTIFEEINDQLSLIPVVDAIAQLYLEDNELNKALALTEPNLLRAYEMGDARNYVVNLATRGRIFMLQGKYQSAYKDAFTALQFGEENNVLKDRLNAYELLIRLDSITNNHQQGVKHFRQLMIFKDSLINIAETEKIAELTTRLKTKDKEQEIILLAKDNELKAIQLAQHQRNITIGSLISILLLALALYLYLQRKKLQKTKQQLESSLGEKETLLKEIHHRVKNNLQLVTSLLNIQAEKESPQTIEEFLTQGQNRVKSMALIHEQLYRSDNISSIDMKEYAGNLVKSIFEIHGNESIIYKVQSDHTHLDIDQAIPLGLIINELVNNALKHAFTTKSEGNLQVQMKQSVDQLEVIVKDDGDGFSSNNSKNSIGLQLVEILTKQLKGTFELHHQAGTTAKLVFPKT